MIRTQVQLTEEQVEKLRRLAITEETSISDLVRRAVDSLVAAGPSQRELRRRALNVIGIAASGARDVASEHDRYLAEAFDE